MASVDEKTAKKTLDEIKDLETEFNGLYTQYQEANANLSSLLSNACYSQLNSGSTGITQACYDLIWSAQKCVSTVPHKVDTIKTYKQLVNETYALSRPTNNSYDASCYGTGTGTPKNTSATAKYPYNGSIKEYANSSWIPTSGNTVNVKIPSDSDYANKDECILGCANTSTDCTVAVFDSNPLANEKKCTFYKGTGTVTTDTAVNSNKTVIMTQNMLTKIQTRMSEIINEINTKHSNTNLQDYILENQNNYNINSDTLEEKYNNLIASNEILQDTLNKYNAANIDYDEQKKIVVQQNLGYRFWTITAIIIFIIIIKYIFDIDSPTSNTIFWSTLIILVSFILHKPSGFAIMGLVLIILLLKSLKDYFTA